LKKDLILPSMRECESILYLEKASSNINNNSKSEAKNILLDYHQYYIFKKKHYEIEMPKEKREEHNIMRFKSKRE